MNDDIDDMTLWIVQMRPTISHPALTTRRQSYLGAYEVCFFILCSRGIFVVLYNQVFVN